jgi:hypothetical protein
MFTVKRTGPWSHFGIALSKVMPEVFATADDQIDRFAHRVLDHLQTNIRQRGFEVADILPATMARRTDKSAPPLMDTHTYVDNLSVQHDTGRGYRVGFRDGARGTKTRALLEATAQRLEFGTPRMASRPHWRPTMAWAKDNIDGLPPEILKKISLSRLPT